MVVSAHQRGAADGDRLLADIQMQEAADFFPLVGAQRALLEAADAHHRAEQPYLVVLGQPLVHGGGQRGTRARGAVTGLGVG